MTIPQLSGNYPEQMLVGIEGANADLAGPKECITGVNESEAMPFGRMTQFDATGTIDRSVKLSNAVARFNGITMWTQAQTQVGTLTGIAQITTVTVGGTATDGTYSITVDGFTATVVRSTTPATNADLGAALRAAVAAEPNMAQIVNVSGATTAVILTRVSPGSFSTTTAAPSPGTLVDALTTGGEQDGVFQNEPANVLRKGTIWLRPEDAVTPASGVFVRITANAGVGTALGAFRGADDGGNTEDISAFAHWVTSSIGGEAGGLAKLEINLD